MSSKSSESKIPPPPDLKGANAELFEFELSETMLLFGIPIPDLSKIVQRTLCEEIEKRKRGQQARSRSLSSPPIGNWDDLEFLTLERLEEICRVPPKSMNYGFVINQVQRALRKETKWDWITIQVYSTLDRPGNYEKDFFSKWSLNFSDNIRDYDTVNLSISKVEELASLCGLVGAKADWLVSPIYRKTEFFNLLGRRFFENPAPEAHRS